MYLFMICMTYTYDILLIENASKNEWFNRNTNQIVVHLITRCMST